MRRVLVLTGASRGLGAAVAVEAARQGFDLVLNARDEARLEAVAAACRAQGAQTRLVVGDIAAADTALALIRAAQEHFGRVDALVHNAGVLPPLAPVAEADLGAWQRNWEVNFFAAVRLLQAALPALREQRGRAVLVSSGAAVHPYPTWGAYGTAKAALNHLAGVVATEEPLVTVVAFRPGVVDTDMQALIRSQGAGVMPLALHARFLAYWQEGRLQPPAAVARPLVAVARAAPPSWSGAFVAYDEARVQALLAAK